MGPGYLTFEHDYRKRMGMRTKTLPQIADLDLSSNYLALAKARAEAAGEPALAMRISGLLREASLVRARSTSAGGL